MYTAGEWKYSAPTGLVYVGGKGIAKVYGAGEEMQSSNGEGRSNARLIAAAPEMYSLLDRIHSTLYRFDIEGIIDVVVLSKIVKESVLLLNRIDGEEAMHD